MTFHTRDGFQAYLLEQKLAPNTTNSYCSGLEHISRHCGEDIYSIHDSTRLNQMVQQYGLKGEFADEGAYSNGSARNALRHWLDYVAKEHDVGKNDKTQPCYLYSLPVEQLAVGNTFTLPKSDTPLKAGTDIYLVRVYQNESGIVAHGVVKASEKKSLICEIDEVRSDCIGGLLPLILLYLAKWGDIPWQTLLTGYQPSLLNCHLINELWHSGRGKHSLNQLIEWIKQHFSSHELQWLINYQSRVEELTILKMHPELLNKANLRWIWQEPYNGICSVAPGSLPTAEFEKNLAFLQNLTLKIFSNPETDTRDNILREWREKVKTGAFTSHRIASINRVFAATDPERFTTLVNEDHLRRLLAFLKDNFALIGNPKQDWIGLNDGLKHILTQAGIINVPAIEANIALWQLFSAIEGWENVMQQSSETLTTSTETRTPIAAIDSQPLNQILSGPPGTGKTYATVNQALSIIEPTLLAGGAERHELKSAFDHYVEEGQIVFTTFHQSYSYEDFVEGIRAVTDETGQLKYQVEDGIFKKICERANLGRILSEDPLEKALKLLRTQIDQTEDGLLEVKTMRGKKFKTRFSDAQNFLIFPESNPELKNGYTANTQKIRQLYVHKQKPTYNPSYVSSLLNYLIEHCDLPEVPPILATKDRKKFVLIIDEINRGNISRIFGELITLIEPSKRAEASEAITITLPYSKQTFNIPDNVYIIGTMNTSDRSLAGMDIALRRRFIFSELMPEPALLDETVIDGVNIGQLLRKMNERIEVMLDRDHVIGHAYFIPLLANPTLKQLGIIFLKQILPLLQEYFFEDWQRIQWVLNDHRKAPDNRFVIKPSDNIVELFGNIEFQHGRNLRWTINSRAFNNIRAYAGILAAPGTAE
ncbi:McrB family protein [Serratia fonticola]|uniref:McrB family protein n=1 Tax=Serratia fonticola TaxID=47917 RepID=UPI0021ADEF9E|nr:AAA family ATPase [Serratia fonticola]